MNLKSIFNTSANEQKAPEVVLPRVPIEQALIHKLLPQVDWDDTVLKCETSSNDNLYPYCSYRRFDASENGLVHAAHFDWHRALNVVSNWSDEEIIELWGTACGRCGPQNSKWSISLCTFNCRVYLVTLLTIGEKEVSWYNAKGDARSGVVGKRYCILARSVGENSLPALKVNFNKLGKLLDKQMSVGYDSYLKNKLFDVELQMYPDFIELSEKWQEFLDSASDKFIQIPIVEFRTSPVKEVVPKYKHGLMKALSICTFGRHDPDELKLTISDKEPILESSEQVDKPQIIQVESGDELHSASGYFKGVSEELNKIRF